MLRGNIAERSCGYLNIVVLAAMAIGLVATVATVAPRPARACSALPCRSGALLPMANAEVPANALALIWRRPEHWTADAGQVTPHLFRIESGSRMEVAFNTQDLGDGLLRIVPTAAQPSGTQLVLEYNEICEPAAGTTSSTAFHVVEPIAVPTSLGKLHAALTQGPVEVWVSTGECTLPVEAARADLEVTLSTEAAPLASVLRYELMVDGKPAGSYFARTSPSQAARLGASVLGPGRDRVYALCGTTYPRTSDLSKNLSNGKHSVQMVGILPDDTRVLSDVVEVDLTCASTPADGGLTDAADSGLIDASDGGLVETADGSSRDGGSSDATDGSRSDGALTDAADGSFVDGGPNAVTDSSRSDGAPTEVASNPGDSGGCACNLAVPGTARTSGWLLSMALAGLAFRRRRGNPIAC